MGFIVSLNYIGNGVYDAADAVRLWDFDSREAAHEFALIAQDVIDHFLIEEVVIIEQPSPTTIMGDYREYMRNYIKDFYPEEYDFREDNFEDEDW